MDAFGNVPNIYVIRIVKWMTVRQSIMNRMRMEITAAKSQDSAIIIIPMLKKMTCLWFMENSIVKD